MSNTAVAAKAVEPAETGTVDHIVTSAVAAHLHLGRTPDADERVEVLAGVLADTRWRNYRAGRVRVAGLLGVYWHWCAPPLAEYQPADNAGGHVMWSNGTIGFTDVVAVDGSNNDPELIERVAAAERDGHNTHNFEFVGVRLLRLSAPNRSRLICGGSNLKLIDTDVWFGGGRA